MEQVNRVGFQLSPNPWPEHTARVEEILGQLRAQILGSSEPELEQEPEEHLGRSRSKATAGTESAQERPQTQEVSAADRDAIRRSTANISLLALYHNVDEETIESIKAEAVKIA